MRTTAPGYYILDDDGEPTAVDALTWGIWLETTQRQQFHVRVVLQTRITRRGRADERPLAAPRSVKAALARGRRVGVFVSTVFLGLDHNFSDDGPPVLWESLVFGGVLDGEGGRYVSKLDALAGHGRLVERVQAAAHVPRRLRKALAKAYGERLGRRETRLVARFNRRASVNEP